MKFRFNYKKDISPKYLLLTLSVICIALIIVSAFFPDSLRPVRSITGRLIVPLQKGVNNIGEYIDDKLQVFGDIKELKKENEKLRQEISEYQKELSQSQAELTELADALLPNFTTDLTNPEILRYVYLMVTRRMSIGETHRLPVDGCYTEQGIRGMAVLVPDLEQNSAYLHEWIYGG